MNPDPNRIKIKSWVSKHWFYRIYIKIGRRKKISSKWISPQRCFPQDKHHARAHVISFSIVLGVVHPE